MSRMHTVKIDEDTMIEMLMDRLITAWNPDDPDIVEIYHQYYTDMVENGVYDNTEFDVMDIVDNDWINYTDIYAPEDAALEYDLEMSAEPDTDEYIDDVIDALEDKGETVYVYHKDGIPYLFVVH